MFPPEVPSPPSLSIRGLWKRFGQRVAVADLSLDVPAGCFYGIVGPNGAGKTTIMRMATGLLRPDAGEVLVEGLSTWRDPVAVKARIGVLPDDQRLFERLSGRELLIYCGMLRRMPGEVVRRRADELLAVLGLSDAAGVLVVDYSHGMRKKIALAAILVHAPRLLFLDEPFEGIDPVSARAIRDVLGQFISAGRTIVFSSHVMDEVERLCQRVAVLHQGRIVAEGTLEQVKGSRSLEDAFVELVGAGEPAGRLGWFSPSPG